MAGADGLRLRRTRTRSRALRWTALAATAAGLLAGADRVRVHVALVFGKVGRGDAPKTEAAAKAQEALQTADAVCFDVDSTVVQTEGIDLLARCFGVYDAVANLTKTAMEGNVKFQDAMAQRLDIMQPTKDGVRECLAKERPKFTRDMKKVMARLQERQVAIYLVSGGFTMMIEPIADILKIPRENIFANTILFDDDGNYKDFDRTAYTSKSGGKPAVVKHLKKTKGYKTVVMIGDGATDMDARPPADAFIGYGGVQVRAKVKEGADWFITHWGEVLKVLA